MQLEQPGTELSTESLFILKQQQLEQHAGKFTWEAIITDELCYDTEKKCYFKLLRILMNFYSNLLLYMHTYTQWF